MAEKTGSSFYEELIKADFYQGSTKQASSNEDGLSKEAAKSMLDSFSSDQLEALAQEFDDMIGKTASSTLEDDILEVLAEEGEKGKKEFPFKKKESKKADSEDSDEEDEDEEEEDEEDDKEEKGKKKEAGEDIEAQLLKEACDKALDMMSERGLSLADYAYSRFDDPEYAVFIADKAEKLAFITEQNPLIVVDDIINSIESKFSEE